MAQQIPGELHVANDVLADLAGNAAMQCYGVVGMTAANPTNEIITLLPANRLRRGVEVTNEGNGVIVDLFVVIEYGTNINVVSKNLTDAVTFALTHYAQVPIAGINVHVQDVKIRK